MRKQMIRLMVPAALALAAIPAVGPAQDTGKKVGEKLDRAGRGIRDGLNGAGQEAKDRFAAARTSIQNLGVESRVYGRLHWDKALNDATIDLTTTEAGVVTLNGSVATAPAKARAVELTRETVGVTEVVDRLAVRPAATTTPARTQLPVTRP